MEKKDFQAESKRLLDLMVNSIYTNKDIFLRELISNSSDAIDKIYYKALVDEDISFNKENYYIDIDIDKDNRILTVSDTGIGMTEEELESNLGVIAKSGSHSFKSENELKDGFDIIGQFGVGFYSAFMVAENVKVISKTFGSDKAYKWESDGNDGYTISKYKKDCIGTDIILKIKENTEEESYDEFLEEYKLKEIVKRYSDFIRYPIKMMVTKSKLKEGTEDEYEEYEEKEVINNMIPIWRKNKNELTEEDYENFYSEKHYGVDKPIKSIHMTVDGIIRYNALLFIPRTVPYDFYTQEYEKGLELYSSGVLIMDKCSDLLPDHFSFIKGIVDSEDLSLNISRELLQHDRQLKLIAKKLEEKIKDELSLLLKNERDDYEEFFNNFGMQLKFGIYNDFGVNKEILQDLILFYSSKEKKLVTLKEYVDRMPDEQKYIYYASGDSIDRIDKLPQAEVIKDQGYEILYLTDDIDEFTIKALIDYNEKEFRSVSSDDLGIKPDEKDKEVEAKKEENKDLFEEMKNILSDKVTQVTPSKRLKNNPVCISSHGDLSIEMEKVLNMMPEGEGIKAEKVLEINIDHHVFNKLQSAFKEDKDELKLYTELLYNQALLIEDLPIEDPVEFTNNIWKLM